MAQTKAKTTPKDFFLHLLSIVTLYFAAGNFLALAFQYINILIPQIGEEYYAYEGYLGTIRWAISSLFVVFPVYLWSTWLINKISAKDPSKKEIWVRRWLLYFTLFITALVIIGDLVVLINRLLEGEFTLRFILKVIAVLFVAGQIFGYYLLDLRENKFKYPFRKIFAYTTSAFVLVGIVSGFFMIGSPAEQRARQLDATRVQHLQQLQYNLVDYWQNKGKLPIKLEDLNDDLRGVFVPKDPETGVDYGYAIKGKEKFELCAAFAKASEMQRETTTTPYPYAKEAFLGQSSWNHTEGNYCFERTIDKDFFAPKR